MNGRLLLVAARVWATEIVVAGLNYFVLIQRIYEPRWGDLLAHQIGMVTRMAVILGFAYLLLRYARGYTTRDLVHIGVLWLILTLIFEWAGSLLIQRRTVADILIGWHLNRGYLWPLVLFTYLTAPLIVGLLLHPRRPAPAT